LRLGEAEKIWAVNVAAEELETETPAAINNRI
jgi:hypothetical protein